MQHKANPWIETFWLGAQVKRTMPEGHEGIHTVVECFWDENGALHCKDDAGFWTPAAMLIVEKKD